MREFGSFISSAMSPEELFLKIVPYISMEFLSKYFRLEIEGSENIPRRGSAIIAPNHSGFSGLDALLLAHVTHFKARRIARILTHRFWFTSKLTAIPLQKLGFTKATIQNGVAALKRNNVVIVFPEGEDGNFKPSSKKYQLQNFKTGFVRMALETQSPIVPTLIIGAEETHINLRRIDLSRIVKGLSLPLPLNIIPLPAKWRIKFLPPVYLPFQANAIYDKEFIA